MEIKETIISLETAKLAVDKNCELITLKVNRGSFSRRGDALKFCQNHQGKHTDTSFLIFDEGNDEHGGNYSYTILLDEFENLPTQSLLQTWLRRVHNIEIAVQWFDKCYIKSVKQKPFKANTYTLEGIETYEEGLELALFEGLNLID